MAEPQTSPSDRIPSDRTPSDRAHAPAAAAEAAANLKGEARSFAENGVRVQNEAAGAARDLSQTAAEAARVVSKRSRETARDMAGDWRDMTHSMLAMQMEFTRWFDDLWRQAGDFGLFPALQPARPFAALGAAPMLGLPPVDFKETKDAYRLCVELPGLKRDEIDLEIRDDVLTLSGHKAEEKEDAGAAYRVSERRFGRFERRFPLPPGVDRAKIAANFRDGLLSVSLPKTGEAAVEGTKVQVQG